MQVSLRDFVKSYGGSASVAAAVGVTVQAVNYWLRKEAAPSLRVTWKLLDLGAEMGLTLDGIVKSTIKPSNFPIGFLDKKRKTNLAFCQNSAGKVRLRKEKLAAMTSDFNSEALPPLTTRKMTGGQK
jgi:transcriptional regulator with XRE-family HTH domain